MSYNLVTNSLAKKLGISKATIKRIGEQDNKFPSFKKFGRDKYYDEDSTNEWLKSRSSNPGALRSNDKIISGARLLELTSRSKGWLWMNVVKPKRLTRLNLSPSPMSNKLVNFYIEREVYEAFGDLIAVNQQQIKDGEVA